VYNIFMGKSEGNVALINGEYYLIAFEANGI
jgi:hypothetical protein